MPYPEHESSEQSFYSRFKDKTLSAVQKRGVETPRWEDVLMVAADVPETRKVLHDQGISGSGLQCDIQYSMYFGRPEPIKDHLVPEGEHDIYSRAINELKDDIEVFKESQRFLTDPDNLPVTEQFLGFLNGYLDYREQLMNDPEEHEVVRVKEKVLQETLNGFMEQAKPTFPEAALPDGLDENVAHIMQSMVAEANNGFTAMVLSQYRDFALKKGKVIATHDQPLLLLDVLDQVELSKSQRISPFQIVDTARKAADPFLKYILYRNGLVTPEGYEAPYSMPPPTVIIQALFALDFVEEHRQKTVEIQHLLPGLLKDAEVLRLLVDLDAERNISEKKDEDPLESIFGFKRGRSYSRDFIKFFNVVQNALAPEQEGGDKFRYRPTITDELRQFLKQAEPAVTNGHRLLAGPRLFGELISYGPVREILIKAGLTEEQLARWPQVLEEASIKKEKEEETVKDKKDIPFKISDRQLEDLLDEYGSERTKLALDGKLDPVIGRENEVRNMVRILLQRGKSNPLLLGEAGVGKTVLFDALAQKIASGDVPKSMVGARVIAIDLSAMNSGAMFRGEFEGKLLPIVQGVTERNAKRDKPPIILCVDELHAALQAGTASGTPGAGELLKPALAKGELSIVGATTQGDYAKHIEKDTALNRRFEPIFINPPDADQTVTIVTGLRETYKTYHEIDCAEELIPMLVRLTDRYLPNLNQPDKAISILDAAMAHAKMKELPSVDQSILIDTIAAAAKLDPRFLQENEGARYLKLREELPQEVLGQEEAVQRIADALIIAKADLHDPRKPLGQFLLMGPTGVGKTETARALARKLFGTEEALIRIDMSNMREKHEDSRLFGAPPGFVGHGEEGQLTGAVRRKPYAVVLLDEIEKADPEVVKRLLPILEEGEITDGRGQKISFRNTIILMTSNLGVDDARREYNKRTEFFRTGEVPWRKITYPVFEKAAKERFAPEFLNRLDAQVIYDPLSEVVIENLVDREVSALSQRVENKWGLTLSILKPTYDQIAKDGYNDEYGARFLKRTVTTELIRPLATWLLQNESSLTRGATIEVSGIGDTIEPRIILPNSEPA